MNKTINSQEIFGRILLVILIMILIILTDIKDVQYYSSVYLELYSTINITLWTIQATLSTLMIAFASFFVGKLENTYYGISVKEILVIDKNNKLELNFFEHIVVGFLLNAVSFIAICCDSMWGVVTVFLLEMYIILYIVKRSFSIVLDEKEMKKLAKNQANYILKQALLEPKEDINSKYYKELKKMFNIMIENFNKDINFSNELHNDDNCIFFLEIEKGKEVNKKIFELKLNNLKKFFDSSIKLKKYELAYNLALIIIYISSYDYNDIINLAIVMYREYRNGNISKNNYFDLIRIIINKINAKDIDSYKVITAISLYSINNCDKDLFKTVTRAILNSNSNSFISNESDLENLQFYSHTILAYIYYLRLEQPKHSDNYYELDIKEIEEFINGVSSDINEFIGRIHNGETIKQMHSILLFLNDGAFISRLAIGRFLYELGSSNIHSYMKDYVIFYLYTHYDSQYKYIFDEFSLDDLIDIRSYFENDGQLYNIKNKYYNIFLELINSEDMKKDNNLELVGDLDNEIGNKKYNTDNNQNKGETNGKDENANPRPNK